VTAHDDWTITQLSMTSLSRTAAPQVAQLQSIRMEAEGCVAMVDIDLIDAKGDAAVRGHVVCLRSSPGMATASGKVSTGVGHAN